jgi:thiamine-monophosphate kinase
MVEEIRRRAAGSSSQTLRLGIGDDCAILAPPPGHDLLVTTDLSLEGRHFRRDWHSASSIGHRTLARGLSDLAAMGAHPLAAFLSLALPRPVAANPRWLRGYLDGLLALARLHNVPLAGGDTAEAPGGQVFADIVLLGTAPAGTALRRSGACPGDALYVTGRLGGAAAELEHLSRDPKSFRQASPDGRHPHLFPQPRLATGEALRHRGLATACIDLSDGLSSDLAHLCTASGVAAEIQLARLPRSPLLRATRLRGASKAFALHALLHGGEDYELLFTASAKTAVPNTLGGVPLTRIGTILRPAKSRPQVVTLAANGKRTPLEPGGWEHFQ